MSYLITKVRGTTGHELNIDSFIVAGVKNAIQMFIEDFFNHNVNAIMNI
jgi:hypothetical protein